VLPFTPPGRDVLFYRGQFCGLRVPGAPPVPGGPDDPALMMACLLDRYPPECQDRFLQTYAGYGYTHLQRSIGHALANPDGSWAGVSLAQFIALNQRAQRIGLFADVWFLGGEALMTRDQDATYWQPILQPVIDALLAAQAIDSACVGWQLDQYNQPGNALIGIIAYVADALPPTIPVFTHWVNEALAWWKTGGEVWTDRYGAINVHDRFSWWLAMRPYLTGGHHQGNTTMARTDPGLYQAKMRDTLNPFSDGRMGWSRRSGVEVPFRLTVFECTAQDQFNGACPEDEGDLVGYLLTCTKGDGNGGVMAGYGNGARMPDGSPL